MRAAQYVYIVNMILPGLTGSWQIAYGRERPDLQARRLSDGAYHASLIRSCGLVAAAIIAIGVAVGTGSAFGTYAYLLIWPVGMLSRRVADRDRPMTVDGPSGTNPLPHRT
jgi:hypothetical protein